MWARDSTDNSESSTKSEREKRALDEAGGEIPRRKAQQSGKQVGSEHEKDKEGARGSNTSNQRKCPKHPTSE